MYFYCAVGERGLTVESHLGRRRDMAAAEASFVQRVSSNKDNLEPSCWMASNEPCRSTG